MATTKPPKLNLLRAAIELGVSRVTLRTHLGKAGAPQKDAKGLYDVEACRAWLARESSAAGGSEIRDLRARKLRVEVDAMEKDLALERGDLVRKTEIVPAVAAFNAQLAADLAQMEIELPAKCHGKDRLQIQAMVGEWRDRILKNLKAGQWALGIPKE